MKNELYKFFKSKLLYIMLAVIFVILFLFSLLFYYIKTDEKTVGYDINYYSSFDVVLNRIEDNNVLLIEIETAYSNGEIEKEAYEQQKELILTQNVIYKFIYDNDLVYKDIQTIEFLGLKSSRVAFINYIYLILQILIPVLVAIVIAYSLNYDFQIGTVKFVYSGKTSRAKVLLIKLISILFLYVFICLICILLTYIFSLAYNNDFKYLLDVFENSVTKIDVTAYTLQLLFSIFIDTFCWFLLFTSVSLLIKSLYVSLGVYFLIYAIFNMFFSYLSISFLYAFSVPFMLRHLNGVSDSIFTTVIILKYTFFTGTALSGIIYFLRKDLV